MPKYHVVASLVCLSVLCLAACSRHQLEQGRKFALYPVSFKELPGWTKDSPKEVLPALLKSCAKPATEWRSFCQRLPKTNVSDAQLRAYFEKTLQPYAVVSYGSNVGKITGYYESELSGSRYQTKASQVPVYGLPYNYKPNQKIQSRKEIEAGKIDAPIIAWADNPVDLFIMHVQGAGRMETPQGEIKLAYAGNNGHPFKSLSSIMSQAGVLEKGQTTMNQMKEWLNAHPQKAKELLAKNPRYIFFREMKAETPIGSAGYALTPMRSVAVDKNFIPMGTLMWLDTYDGDKVPLRRMVVAQDTGAAITGPIRADFFWGHGSYAFYKAGRMHSNGRYFLLLPK